MEQLRLNKEIITLRQQNEADEAIIAKTKKKLIHHEKEKEILQGLEKIIEKHEKKTEEYERKTLAAV